MMPRPLRSVSLLLLSLLAALRWPVAPVRCLNSRSQSPEHADDDDSESQTKLVGDYAYAYGTNYIRVEGPVLITGLAGTGSDPAPSPQRQALISDMQAHGVDNPNQVLASPTTSMAWAVAYLAAGRAQRRSSSMSKSASPRNPKPPACTAAG